MMIEADNWDHCNSHNRLGIPLDRAEPARAFRVKTADTGGETEVRHDQTEHESDVLDGGIEPDEICLYREPYVEKH